MIQFNIICGHCGETTKQDATFEMNLKDGCMYFLCPHEKCGKMNKQSLFKPPPKLPKSRISR